VNPARPIPRAEPFAAPYWQALRRHEFLLPRSTGTGTFFLPIEAVVPGEFEWAAARREGTIVSYSRVHLQPSEGYALELPYVLATVALDDGPQLLTNIVDATEDEVGIGRRVRLVFEDRAEGWVVAQFTPIESTEER
jgi:uncharacterized OB-fold protein